MGLSLPKLAPGADKKKLEELGPIIDEIYEEKVKDARHFSEFYSAVCEIVEQLNEKLGNTQIKLPEIKAIEMEYRNRLGNDDTNKKRLAKEEFQEIMQNLVPLAKEEFQEIMQNLLMTSGFSSIGAKKAILCIFGVPLAALFIKHRVMPVAVRDEFFIPGVTSATVLTLAALNVFGSSLQRTQNA